MVLVLYGDARIPARSTSVAVADRDLASLVLASRLE